MTVRVVLTYSLVLVLILLVLAQADDFSIFIERLGGLFGDIVRGLQQL